MPAKQHSHKHPEVEQRVKAVEQKVKKLEKTIRDLSAPDEDARPSPYPLTVNAES